MVLSLVVAQALAHHPHDPIEVADLSPAFAADATVLSTRYPCQNWRTNEIVRTEDAGLSWWSSQRGLVTSGTVVDMALSPTFDSDGMALVSTDTDGAFLTTDGAATWVPVLPDLALGAAAMATDANGDLVFLVAATDGTVWRSVDLGATWSEALFAGAVYSMHAFGMEVVIGAGTAVRTSQDAGATWDVLDLGVTVESVAAGPGVRVVGTEAGAFLSTTVGVFEPLEGSTGAPTSRITAVGVSPDWPNDPRILLAEYTEGPYVSVDGGASFTAQPTPLKVNLSDPLHFYSFRMAPTFGADPTVLLNTFEGLALSRDGGMTWAELDTRTPGMICGIGVSPEHDVDGTVLLGTFDAGMLQSTDRGRSFEVHNLGLVKSSVYDVDMGYDPLGQVFTMIGLKDNSGIGTAPFDTWELRPFVDQYSSRVALDPEFATTRVAVQGHRSAGLIRTTDGGMTWEDRYPGNTSAITSLAFSDTGAVAVAGTKAGEVLVSLDRGASWAAHPDLPPLGPPAWVAHGGEGFVIGRGDGVLMLASDGVAVTRDAMLTGAVHQVASAPDGTRFVAMRGGALWRSDPGQQPWVAVGPELEAHGMPHELKVSPTFATDGVVYAAVDEWLYLSEDRGDSFEVVGPTVERFEEDVTTFWTDQEEGRIPTRTLPGASVARVGLLLPGMSVALTFTGDGVAWVGHRGGETVEVTLDGVVVATVDTSGTPAGQEVMYEATGLVPGPHTLTLKNTGAVDAYMDAIDVYRPLPARVPPTVDTADTGFATADTGAPTVPTTPPTPTTMPTEPTSSSTLDTPSVGDDAESTDEAKGCGCSVSGGTSGLWMLMLALVAIRRETRR